jgi:hypothetical protein
MKTQINPRSVKLWLSSADTYRWAHKSGASWPCSQVSGRRLFAEFDSNGLLDLSIDGGRGDQDCDGNELSTICADHLRAKLPKGHPAFAVAVAQFATA